jgi:predicted metalloprotease
LKKLVLILLAVASAAQGPVQAQNSSYVNEWIEASARFLVANWMEDAGVKKYSPPQVLPISTGSKVYGACGENITGDEVGGSAYCPATHTVYLVPEELGEFEAAFGSSSVAYVVAHEFGHAFQSALEIPLSGPAQELQADCFAGMLIGSGSETIGINRDDVRAMATAAYNIGSDTHGTGGQRAFALFTGMGVIDGDCKAETMQSLATGAFDQDPRMLEMTQERSAGGSRINTSETPYPKDAKALFGL